MLHISIGEMEIEKKKDNLTWMYDALRLIIFEGSFEIGRQI